VTGFRRLPVVTILGALPLKRFRAADDFDDLGGDDGLA